MKSIKRKNIGRAGTLISCFVLVMSFQNCGQQGLVELSEADLASQLPPGLIESPSAGPFYCDASRSPTQVSARRLTKVEYGNTIRRLLSKQATSDYNAIMLELDPLIATIPDDVDAKFSRLDSKFSQTHLNAYLYVAKKLGSMVAATQARARAFFGSCATTANLSSACMDTFFAGQGAKIYRRPLTSAEITSLKSDVNGYVSDKNAFLIARMLMSTYFLTTVELNGTEISPTLLQISPYELASRLSYHFQQNMPDDELFAAAANGSLNTDAGLNTQIERLMATGQVDQTKTTIAEFFSQWLGLYQLPNPSASSTPQYLAFADGDSLSKASMVQEIQDMTDYYTFKSNGTFADLLTSEYSFAKNADLANIYGVARWTGDVNAMVRLPAGERSGILTRAAFLANSTTATSPIVRGVKVRREFLCDVLAQPPAEIGNMLRIPDPDPNLTTRQRYEHKTADALCMGCHAQINPIGFVFESFDSLGRYRSVEKVYSDTGALLGQKSIDPVVVPLIMAGDQRRSSTPVQFNSMMAESGKAQNCFVRQYFHFTYRQAPNILQDGCALEEMRQNLANSGGSLRKMFMDVAKARAFKLKNLVQ